MPFSNHNRKIDSGFPKKANIRDDMTNLNDTNENKTAYGKHPYKTFTVSIIVSYSRGK